MIAGKSKNCSILTKTCGGQKYWTLAHRTLANRTLAQRILSQRILAARTSAHGTCSCIFHSDLDPDPALNIVTLTLSQGVTLTAHRSRKPFSPRHCPSRRTSALTLPPPPPPLCLQVGKSLALSPCPNSSHPDHDLLSLTLTPLTLTFTSPLSVGRPPLCRVRISHPDIDPLTPTPASLALTSTPIVP